MKLRAVLPALILLTLTTVSLTATAKPTAGLSLDQACVATYRSAGYQTLQGRALCAQFTPEEKRCLIMSYHRHRDFKFSQEICRSVSEPTYPSYDDSPYPWARSGGGFCDQNPGNISCQHSLWYSWY